MDDKCNEWLREYRRGNTDALEKLEREYRQKLFNYIFKMTSSLTDAEDCYQEVWLRAIRNLDSFRDKHFSSWLFRIAHNLIVDKARKNKIKVDPHLPEDQVEGRESWTARVPSLGPDPSQEVTSRDLCLRVETAVSYLPPEQQEVFILRMEGGLSFKEIAKIQNTTVSTALSRMQYALNKLREILRNDFEALLKGQQ